MKFNFKKISAITGSLLLAGMSVAIPVAAANYPQPFVVGGTANAAIVYGTGAGVSTLDVVESANIQTNLQSYMGTSTGTDASVSGEAVSLDTSGTRIWLNTSLNTAKSTLTKTDLPTVLGDNTFSGNVEAKMTSNIKFFAGAAAGGANSGKVTFAKQPRSSDDPVVGISLGSSATTTALYNLSVTFKAVNMTHADSEGETISLFGADYVVSTATSATELVLFSSAEEVTLSAGGANPITSATVNIDGTDYLVEIVSASDTSAIIAVDGEQKEINEGSSKKVGGIEVAVKIADENTALDKVTATLLVGSDKITFAAGTTVTRGADEDPIDGTTAYLTGGPEALTELAVSVFKPDSSNDAIATGETFVDPVFKSFKVDFVGLNSPLDDTNRETISILSSGDDSMSITMIDQDGSEGTFIFAHNQSGSWFLGDDNNETIHVLENANITESDYVILGNEDYGHLLELTQVYNNTGTDATKDIVKLRDVLSGTTYSSTFTSEGDGTIAIDGKTYTVSFIGTGDTGVATFKYPTGDSANAHTFVLFPSIQTQKGAQIILYEPFTFPLGNASATGYGDDYVTTINIPDGDGYTAITTTHLAGGDTLNSTWTIGGVPVNTSKAVDTNSTGALTVGQLTYNFTSTGTDNSTKVYLINPEDGGTNIDQPAVIILEGKDDKNEYHAIVVDLETAPNANSDAGVGVNDILYSAAYGLYKNLALASDSKITKDLDWWGALVTTDATDSDQSSATISYPQNQIYAQIYIGEESSAITAGTTAGVATALGDVLVKDTEVSSVATKNLIVVGGSCINSAAASLVGGAHCGAGWTTATGVGSGEFLIKSYASSTITSKIALLVAGYDAADTVNAATYLRTQTVDTSKEYKGTSSTSATLVTTEVA